MLTKIMSLGETDGPLLFFGGPYSNLQATQAMQQAAARLGIPARHIICTGDLLAYCGEPSETLELIRDWGIHVVKGNCEASLAADAGDCGCGFEAGSACSLLSTDWYDFVRQRVDADQKAWMSRLPERVDLHCNGRTIAVIHGGLDQINRFIFPSTASAVKERELELAATDIVIGGHSGIPGGQRLGQRAWLNSGVIGMPANDGSRDGWYLLLTPAARGLKASWHRLVYDAQAASDIMRQKGLCGGYDKTLLDGLWPSMDILPEGERSGQGRLLALDELML